MVHFGRVHFFVAASLKKLDASLPSVNFKWAWFGKQGCGLANKGVVWKSGCDLAMCP